MYGGHCSLHFIIFFQTFQVKCSKWTSIDLLSGGLVNDQPLNLNEEKAEVDMTSSAATEDPEDESINDALSENLVHLMSDPRCQDSRVKVCLRLIERLCRENHLLIHMNFPDDHPVEEVGRVLLALLVKYQGMCMPNTETGYICFS